jgi:hypothetical protein
MIRLSTSPALSRDGRPAREIASSEAAGFFAEGLSMLPHIERSIAEIN